MKKRKGLSLVEALVSVVLLAAISLILVTGIMSSYKYLMQTKSLTTDTYAVMQEVENHIKDIRKELDLSFPDMTAYTIWDTSKRVFGEPVYAYEVLVEGEYGSIWTVVGKNTYENLPTPSISISAAFLNENFETASYFNNALMANSYEILNDDENKDYYMMTTYRWYVSKAGYYISSNDESDYLSGNQYPIFPTDYIAIETASGTSSTVNLSANAYLGRHVLVVATPVSTSGKMGRQAVSNPVYVSGLPPFGSSLRMHLDASLISLNDYEAYLAGSGTINRWTDFTGNGYDASVIPSGLRIFNRSVEFGDSYANALEFSGGISMVGGMGLPSIPEFTMFAVVNSSYESVDEAFIRTSTNDFSLSLNQLKLDIDILPFHGVSGDEWYAFGIIANKSTEPGVISVRINNGEVQEIPMSNADWSGNFSDLLIGADGVSLAEIILYDETLDSENYDKVWSYLREKYDLDSRK